MAWQIIKQPDGLYAIFSTNVDDFIVLDATKDEIIEEFVEEEKERLQKKIKDVEKIIEKVDAGSKPYHQFTKTWEDCLETIKEVHGESGLLGIES